MMRLGSVILKVEPRQVADRMWYFPLLVPYKDHIPVKADLSDLEEKIRWCREHDDECRQIGENAKQFYERYVARDALLDYIEMICKQISKRFVPPPSWWTQSPTLATGEQVEPPKLRKPDVPCYEDRQNDMSRLCIRCREDADAELQELELLQAQKTNEKLDVVTRRQALSERRKRKASALAKK
jgi:Glycosyl transferase family 90